MIIGVPRETKDSERRVGLTPAAVNDLTTFGHRVVVEQSAGVGSGAADAQYEAAGAAIVARNHDVYRSADLIVKVKEPQEAEIKLLRPAQILFTYLHLASDPRLTGRLIESGATCIAYETITDDGGHLPLLTPMSRIAGRLAVQAGAQSLEATNGGAGLLMGGVPGTLSAKVVVIGGGVVGENAVDVALGMGADVSVLDSEPRVLTRLARRFGSSLGTMHPTPERLSNAVVSADLVIGAVLSRGARSPKLVSRDAVEGMRPGSAIVDVAIDQGGCFETSSPTLHSAPRYVLGGVVHYCVTNMPAAVPRTSTEALSAASLPYVMKLADQGIDALLNNGHFRRGVNIAHYRVTEPAVAQAHGLEYFDPATALRSG